MHSEQYDDVLRILTLVNEEQRMGFTRNPGRTAGLLYLLGSVPGFFALLYVPGKLFVHGDPIATAHNIAAHELLFRWGIFGSLICQAVFIFVALALYQLLKGVDRRYAALMVILITVPVPIGFVNELNSVAALMLARGSSLVPVVDESQRIAWMRFFLDLRGAGYDLAGIFWGLWLFPLGLLVYRSGFIPKLLGILLMAGCFAYLANSFTSLVLPSFADAVARWMDPVQLVEMVFMLWLLIRGAVPKSV
jgi:hypothetical protein